VSPAKKPPLHPGRLASLRTRRERASALVAVWRKQTPDPRCELTYQTPFQLLVSVILSAQTTDKMVNRCMEPLQLRGMSPHSLIEMGVSAFQAQIKSIGLAPTKAKNVLATAKILLEQYAGEVPNDRTALESLPGVGRKTANVILGEIFRHPTIAVDTHVFRVGFRLGLHNAANPLSAEQELLRVMDQKDLPAAHHWLILHGRYTCKAQKPLCEQCQVAPLCPSLQKTLTRRTQ